jgi:hypothetical protein
LGPELQRAVYAFNFSYYAEVYKMGEARVTKVDKKIGEIERLLKSKRDEILEIAARHGATNVRIFGSASRGEAGEESDVDLLVDVGPGRTPLLSGGTPGRSGGAVGLQGRRGKRTRDQAAYQRASPLGGGAAVRDKKEQLKDVIEAIAIARSGGQDR